MSKSNSQSGRRTFLAMTGSIAALGAIAGLPVVAQAMIEKAPAGTTGDPWVGRDLSTGERFRMQNLAEALKLRLHDAGVEVRVLDNHVRLRMPAEGSFHKGKDALTPEGVALLTLVAEAMVASPLVRVEIVGHHDAKANAYEASVFTKRRAEAARATLMSRKISGGRIRSTGLGGLFPYVRNATDPANRRLELLFRPL